MSLYAEVTQCRLCHRTTDLIEVLDLGHQALTGVFPKSKDEKIPCGPLELVKCMSCGLVQLAHNYDLGALYGSTYGYRSGLNQSMVRHLQRRVHGIEQRVKLDPGDLVLDIGSNDGTLLASYSLPNIRRIGIDPVGQKFKHYYPSSAELITDFFNAAAVRRVVGSQKAKVVSSIAMFYDLEDPMAFVEDILEVLADDGIWVFEQSYLPKMLATCSYDTICHEHLEYYALKQVVYLAQRLGLKIVDVEINDVNGGSFCVTVSKKGSAYPEAEDRVASILADEESAGLDTTEPFECLQRSMRDHRRRLLDLLQNTRTNGQKVFGYGASTKGNVLLQYCGIDSTLLPVIAEVNEDKFGAFTPGTQIPIVSEQDARALLPDYFLVLPWHFRQAIAQREEAYLQRGGKLIFPLPSLEVISAPLAMRARR